MKSAVKELSDAICLVGKTNNTIMTQLLKHQIITHEIAVQMYEKFEPDEKELKLIKGFKEFIEQLKTQMYKH